MENLLASAHFGQEQGRAQKTVTVEDYDQNMGYN
jgi:hypothetical protein